MIIVLYYVRFYSCLAKEAAFFLNVFASVVDEREREKEEKRHCCAIAARCVTIDTNNWFAFFQWCWVWCYIANVHSPYTLLYYHCWCESASARSQWPSWCIRKYLSSNSLRFFFFFNISSTEIDFGSFSQAHNLSLSCTRSPSMCVCVCRHSGSEAQLSSSIFCFVFVFHRMQLYCCRFTIGFNLTLVPFVSAIHFAYLFACSYPIRHKYMHIHADYVHYYNVSKMKATKRRRREELWFYCLSPDQSRMYIMCKTICVDKTIRRYTYREMLLRCVSLSLSLSLSASLCSCPSGCRWSFYFVIVTSIVCAHTTTVVSSFVHQSNASLSFRLLFIALSTFLLSWSATDYHITELIPNQMQYIAFDPSHIQIFHGNGLTAQIVSTFVIVLLRVELFFFVLFCCMFFAHFRSTKIGLPHQREFIFAATIEVNCFRAHCFGINFKRWNVAIKRLFVYRVILQLVPFRWSEPYWNSRRRNFRVIKQ